MILSKNRLKNILIKKKVQTQKKLKNRKKYGKKKNRKKYGKKKNSFRKKKINIRTKSIKQYRKRFAKKKRKVYIRGGGNSYYDIEIVRILEPFYKQKNLIAQNAVAGDSVNYYNFNFLFNDDNDDNDNSSSSSSDDNSNDDQHSSSSSNNNQDLLGPHINNSINQCVSSSYVADAKTGTILLKDRECGENLNNWFIEIVNSF